MRNILMDGSEWITRIRKLLEEEEEDEDISASIAGVPIPLICNKPEAYIPQLIALGPYHHTKEELHHMERYKLSTAKKIRTRLPDKGFEHTVGMFCKVENRIRAHYQRYLPFNGETLAWMMAIDASFLLEFLQIFSINKPEIQLNIPSKPSIRWTMSSTRRTSTQDMLIRDIIMLENQLPLFLLLKILQLQATSPQIAEESFNLMLVSFLKELTPFKTEANFQSIDITLHSHLLDLLYHSIVPLLHEEKPDPNDDETIRKLNFPQTCSNLIKGFMSTTKVLILDRTKAFLSLLIKFLIKIPWSIITSIPTFAAMKLPIENMFNPNVDPNMDLECTMIANQGLSLDEIAIPSVIELTQVGIRFEPTSGDLSTITFDSKTCTLHLPSITLDVNSEVILRNLVAYEAAVVTGPLVFTRYVEFMNGIVDTEEDAKVLREIGVLVNRLRSDEEVAELWNGMSRSVRLTKVAGLDEVIEEVNRYYNGRLKVKVRRFMGRYVRRYLVSSWECLVVVVVVLLVMVVGLQAFSTGLGLRFGSWAYMRRGGRP